MPSETGRSWSLAALALAMLATGWAPAATAHNPADTIFAPVQVGSSWLAVGGEGTYAYLDTEGSLLERGNLSGEGEVLRRPAQGSGTAAALVRSFPDLVPQVHAFDDEGPAWRTAVGEAEGNGYLLPRADGYTYFSRDGRQVDLDADGEIVRERGLDVNPRARPAPARQGGWWLASGSALVHLSEGEILDEAGFSGSPTDVTATADGVLVSLTHRDSDKATLMSFTPSLELNWSRSVEALRLGGHPAVLDDRIVVGTYDPSGARLIALEPSGTSIAWDRRLPNATAAAPSAVQGTVVAATTEGLVGLDADGNRLWDHPTQPYLDSPSRLNDLVVASGSANRLVALHANGTLAWTWTDGVETPSWSTHHDDGGSKSEPTSSDGELLGVGLWPLLVGGAALAVLVAVELRRRQG